jgi:predicted lipoprotein
MASVRPGLRPLALVALAACGGGGDPPVDGVPDTFDRRALLTHLANGVLLPIQHAVADTASALPAAIEAHCDVLDAAGDPTASLAAMRAAWRTAAEAWQRADALLVGPAAMDTRALRDRIYAWPLLATCAVDRDTARSWADPGSFDVATVLNNARSLASIEYLVFFTDPTHSCPTPPVGWDALGADLPRARCRHAEALAADVAAQATALAAAWDPTGGNYAGVLAAAGTAGSPIPSAHEGVNRVTDGFFYVDKMVKDMKLGETSGINPNACGTIQTPCLREVEHPYADHATFAIRANLEALRRAFTGTAPAGDGPGFDEFLRALGTPEIADRMVGELDAAIAAAEALPDSFLTALATDYDKVAAAHAATKVFTDDLKSQFLTVLALEIPDDVATDND